jgi:hypothetical protein
LAYELQWEFDRIEATMATRHICHNISRQTMWTTGIILSDSLKEVKRKEYKRSEKAGQEKEVEAKVWSISRNQEA